MLKPRAVSWLVLCMLAIRPILNQFQELAFGHIGGYELSLLSFWSILLIALLLVRMPFAPYLDRSVKNSGLLLLYFLSMVGLPQLSHYGNFALNYLYIVLIIMAMMNGHKIVHDIGMDRITDTLAWSAVVLICMHATGFLWGAKHGVLSEVGGYIGAFESKHIAAYSFIVLIPFTFLKYYRSRSPYWLAVFVANVAFLLMALQRVTMLSLLLGVVFIAFALKKKRYLLYAMVALVIVITLVPEHYYNDFLQDKVMADVADYEQGNFTRIGAGRGGLVIDASKIYFGKMNFFEQLFGKGLGYSDLVHLQVVGVLTYVHLQFLQLFIDMGVVGAILTGIFVSRVFVAKLRIYRRRPDMLNLVALAYLFVFACQFFYDMPLQNGGTFVILAILAFSPSKRWQRTRSMSRLLRMNDVLDSERSNLPGIRAA